MSWDIEADSSHGDFPLPIKSYNKLSNEIIDYSNKQSIDRTTFEDMLLSVFSISEKHFDDISIVYPKSTVSFESISRKVDKILNISNVRDVKISNSIENMFHIPDDSDNEDDIYSTKKHVVYDNDIISFINDKKVTQSERKLFSNITQTIQRTERLRKQKIDNDELFSWYKPGTGNQKILVKMIER